VVTPLHGTESPHQPDIDLSKHPLIENIALLIGFWFGCALTMYLYGFVMMGWEALIVGASKQELYEHLDLLSVPLGWVNRAFVIRPGRSFFAVCGIIICNSYLYALILLPIYKVVHNALRRDRVTQLGINQQSGEQEDGSED
jgi:hypothetical protein